ncbi:Soluble inorganic pyrophosphatase 6, chloroplastic, partial [Linum perenne]
YPFPWRRGRSLVRLSTIQAISRSNRKASPNPLIIVSSSLTVLGERSAEFLIYPSVLVSKGTLTAIRDWFRDYKIPDGKPANKFGLGNKAANKEYALKVIQETNESWSKLMKRSIPAGELSLA